jgi:hypothetical protein
MKLRSIIQYSIIIFVWMSTKPIHKNTTHSIGEWIHNWVNQIQIYCHSSQIIHIWNCSVFTQLPFYCRHTINSVCLSLLLQFHSKLSTSNTLIIYCISCLCSAAHVLNLCALLIVRYRFVYNCPLFVSAVYTHTADHTTKLPLIPSCVSVYWIVFKYFGN